LGTASWIKTKFCIDTFRDKPLLLRQRHQFQKQIDSFLADPFRKPADCGRSRRCKFVEYRIVKRYETNIRAELDSF
jgi:hypothetical protein